MYCASTAHLSPGGLPAQGRAASFAGNHIGPVVNEPEIYFT